MCRSIKISLVVLFCLTAVTKAFSFALLGPPASWQTAEFFGPGRTSEAPMNLGEEYRWNVPVITYAFDPTFLNYFGTNGIVEVEAAIKIMNDLPPTSQMSDAYLSSLPFNTTEVNFQASALSMLDLKSEALEELVRYQGLAAAVNFTWTMRARTVTGNPAITNWLVIMRNFDPITFQPTNVVNGNAYLYTILDNNNSSPQRDAVEVGPFPTSLSDLPATLGGYFVGLTFDDVGGIRYLYRTNNFNVETLLGNVTLATVSATNVTSTPRLVSPWDPLIVVTNVATNIVVGVPTLVTNTIIATAIRGGINKVTFKRVNYDALLGQTIQPVTNFYTDKIAISTNGFTRFINQSLQRPIGTPDIVFSAADIGTDPAGLPFISTITTTGGWINNSGLNRNGGGGGINAGPGVITPGNFLVFNNIGPYYYHSGGADMSGPNPIDFGFVWGSFDGVSIKAVYPEYLNLSTSDLEQMYLQSQGVSP